MKLKYYLRGIGIGVIVTTLIMAVSSVIHNNNLSDEFIIKEAQKLGMIMPEEENNHDSLWGSHDTESQSNAVESGDTQSAEDTQSIESTQSTEDTQSTESTQSTEETQVPEDVTVSEEESTAVISISDIDGAGSVARKLYKLGVIDSEDDFHVYLTNNGYSYKIKSGSFKIKKGASYEEICDIIIRK